MTQGTSMRDVSAQDASAQDVSADGGTSTRGGATAGLGGRQSTAQAGAGPSGPQGRMPRRRPRAPRFRKLVAAGGDDIGMATAEYAIATVAAAGFAGLLMLILRGSEVKALLLGIIRGALSV